MSRKLLVFSILLFLLGGIAFLFSDGAFVFVFSGKIWSHKTNTIIKKQEAFQRFAGVELDLVYEPAKNGFDVNHPPDKSINLSLSDYLKTGLEPGKQYWFDLKNLSELNAKSASDQMGDIIRAAGMNVNQVIVESPNYHCLPFFAAKGFSVSYYLPTLHKMQKDSLDAAVKTIYLALKKYPSLYISSGYRDYPFMKKYFPERDKLLWWTGNKASFWNWKNRIRLSQILSDGTVKVFLVPFHSERGDR